MIACFSCPVAAGNDKVEHAQISPADDIFAHHMRAVGTPRPPTAATEWLHGCGLPHRAGPNSWFRRFSLRRRSSPLVRSGRTCRPRSAIRILRAGRPGRPGRPGPALAAALHHAARRTSWCSRAESDSWRSRRIRATTSGWRLFAAPAPTNWDTTRCQYEPISDSVSVSYPASSATTLVDEEGYRYSERTSGR
jgi:hypothetical protein